MATIITVHGTFAHANAPDAPAGSAADPQWWEIPSTFEHDLRELVDAREGQLEVKPFTWGGDNSEVERRLAGLRLSKELRELEARNEPYCVIGHSHGGSVVSTALLSSARAQAAAAKPQAVDHRRHAVRQFQERALAAHAAQPHTQGDLRCIDDAAADVPGLSFFDESQRRANAVWRNLPAHSRRDRRHDESSPPSFFISSSTISITEACFFITAGSRAGLARSSARVGFPSPIPTTRRSRA